MPLRNVTVGVNLNCLQIQGQVKGSHAEVEGDILNLLEQDGSELRKGSIVKGQKGRIHHGRRFQILDSGQVLNPGDSVYLPVWLYPDFVGREVLQMVWRYETEESGRPNGFTKQRLLQIAHVIECQPLVEVGIGSVGFRVENLFQVKVSVREQKEFEALRKVEMVEIKDVRYLGSAMQITPIDHGMALELRQGEEGVIVCEVEEIADELTPSISDSNLPQISAIQALIGQQTDLVVLWQAKCTQIMGGVLLHTGIAPLSEKILSQVYSSEGVSVSYRGEISQAHDFVESPICIVNVSLVIKNLNKHNASVIIEASQQQQQQTGWTEIIQTAANEKPVGMPPNILDKQIQHQQQQNPGNEPVTLPLGNWTAGSMYWLGLSRSIIQQLQPQEQRLISLQLAVFAPGLYELSGIRCSWNIPKLQTPHTTCKPMPALVEIKQSER
eukprot:TRINITY_DN13626_c0_g1_i3.p1 TRINITY_DN13626_c0_g1~~TRINITY_DN13626_c0_g1_i3.p1  ORF type:complete len:516 (-),score=68.36 TRINITY_DN13626_c0_g1_i3:82-1404(-)